MSNHCGGRGLDIRVTWARTREAPADAPSRIRFTNDVVPVIQEASRHFKEITPEPAEITGIVTQLQRELAILSGPITVTTVIEGRLRKVRVHLAGEDHRLAIEAYEGRIPVRCYGELIREGGSFELRNPRGFAHEPDA
jgi:hypothetical protein